MLSESGAVVQYILEKYGNGRLQPAIRGPDRAAYLYPLFGSERAVPINLYIGMAVYGGSRLDCKPCASESKLTLAFLDGSAEPVPAGYIVKPPHETGRSDISQASRRFRCAFRSRRRAASIPASKT